MRSEDIVPLSAHRQASKLYYVNSLIAEEFYSGFVFFFTSMGQF